jgi:hypothetical protein
MRLPANDLPPIRLTTPRALRQGGIGMAVPGTWVLTGFGPDCDIVQLPVFYGQSIDAVHRVVDGPVGQTINKELEEKLDAKVLGNWLDLGYQNVYSTSKPLTDFKDLAGMKIRNSGSAGQFAKAKFFGATPSAAPATRNPALAQTAVRPLRRQVATGSPGLSPRRGGTAPARRRVRRDRGRRARPPHPRRRSDRRKRR